MGVQQIIVRHLLMLLSVALIGLTACQARPPAAMSTLPGPLEITNVWIDGEPALGQWFTVRFEFTSTSEQALLDVWTEVSIPSEYPIAVFAEPVDERIPAWAVSPQPDSATPLIGTPSNGLQAQITVTPVPQVFTSQGMQRTRTWQGQLLVGQVLETEVEVCVFSEGSFLLGLEVVAELDENSRISDNEIVYIETGSDHGVAYLELPIYVSPTIGPDLPTPIQSMLDSSLCER